MRGPLFLPPQKVKDKNWEGKWITSTRPRFRGRHLCAHHLLMMQYLFFFVPQTHTQRVRGRRVSRVSHRVDGLLTHPLEGESD